MLEKLINDSNVLAIYNYGSIVYGSNNEQSDKDYIIIVKNKEFNIEEYNGIDINIYEEQEFKKLLEDNEITAIECYSLTDNFKIKESITLSYEVNLEKLRSAISAKASNSWVKAKKKLTIEEDYNYNVGIKSAWHSLRILDFGKQVALNGRIVDFSSVNNILIELKECKTWDDINSKYKLLYNNKSSEFKLLAPKTTPKLKM